MAIVWKERPRRKASVEFGKGQSTREYWVGKTLELVEALLTIAAASPAIDIITDLTGTAVQLFRKKMTPRELGNGYWEVLVEYENTPDSFKLKINNGVQTVKMLQALKQVRVYDCITGEESTTSTTNVPDFKGAIGVKGVNGLMTVEGMDNEIGKLEFSITKDLKFSTLDAAYEAYLASVTPSVNDAAWQFVWETQAFIFPRGGVKFRGHTTDQTSDDTLSITHNFAFSKGLTKTDAWNNATTYDQNDLVTFGDFLWKSIDNGNVNHEPVEYLMWDIAETYVVTHTVYYGGNLYEALTINTGKQPDLFPTDWSLIGPLHWGNLGEHNEFRIGAATIVKEGWEFGWPYYIPDVPTSGPRVVLPTPAGFIIDKVSDYSDFGKLECF